MQTQALAIYMPAVTYQQLDAGVQARVNARGSSFYRPLDSFVADVRRFVEAGQRAF
jgi:hypothetical protein